MSRRPEYRLPCTCGNCPKLPSKRPPTKREAWEYWSHCFSHLPHWKLMKLAIEEYAYGYAFWVNFKGWRKPPGWEKGRVPLDCLRPESQPYTPEQIRKWISKLHQAAKEKAAA